MDESSSQTEMLVGAELVVLIGEPDPVTCELYQRTLRTTFQVLTAVDAETLLRLLGTHPLAALVLEPVIFGWWNWERLAAVSRICAGRGIPLIVCSTQDERRRGSALGAAVYLVKPTLPTTLLETVHQVIGRGARHA
jgi:DNA-binding response OmpR family regulator